MKCALRLRRVWPSVRPSTYVSAWNISTALGLIHTSIGNLDFFFTVTCRQFPIFIKLRQHFEELYMKTCVPSRQFWLLTLP